jgi:DNA replication protein DnaD
MGGWIKWFRKVMENELYFSERFDKYHAWSDLVLLATHKPNTFFINGIEINLKVGELGNSQKKLAERWKWSDKTVKKFLEWLKSRNMIDYRVNNITTLITIINYSKYQNPTEQKHSIKSIAKPVFSGLESEQLTEQTPNNLLTNNNDKKVKNNKWTNQQPNFKINLNLIEVKK